MQSYEKEIWHCHLLSPFVTICHLLSPFSKLLFHDAKLRKRNLALSAYVRICPEMSGNVRFCPHFFFAAKLRKEKLALSSYVHLCPFMSSYDIATPCIYVAKLRNRNLAMSKFVQLCPNLSIFWTSSGFGESLRTYNNNAN